MHLMNLYIRTAARPDDECRLFKPGLACTSTCIPGILWRVVANDMYALHVLEGSFSDISDHLPFNSSKCMLKRARIFNVFLL